MNIIKKIVYTTLLALSSLSLTTSMAFADGKTDAEAACPGCHGVIINGIQAVGSGGQNCVQRTAAEWTATIERMNAKGCGVPAGSIGGIANYLAGLGRVITCYFPSGGVFTTIANYCPVGTTSTPPPSCAGRVLVGGSWFCPPTTTCYNGDGTNFIVTGSILSPPPLCPTGTSTAPPLTCSDGLPTFNGSVWECPTLCNTYVNGTTQYPYSGNGSCHSFANDDVTGMHVVRDQSYCKKHMSHFNSKGNHVHAYPHPVCM